MAYFGFYGELYGLKIDSARFTKDLDEKLQRLIRQAAREWLRAVIRVMSKHIWTGFAIGSLKFAPGPNGDLARYLNVSIPIGGTHTSPKWYRHTTGRTTEKIPEKGGLYSYYNFSSAQHRYRFTYHNEIWYYLLNDFYGTHVSGPWFSMQAGKLAFHKYIRENINSLPKIKKYLIRQNPIKIEQ